MPYQLINHNWLLFLMENNLSFITNICGKSQKLLLRNSFWWLTFFLVNTPAWLTKESEIALRSEVKWRLIKGNDSENAFIAFGKFLVITNMFKCMTLGMHAHTNSIETYIPQIQFYKIRWLFYSYDLALCLYFCFKLEFWNLKIG